MGGGARAKPGKPSLGIGDGWRKRLKVGGWVVGGGGAGVKVLGRKLGCRPSRVVGFTHILPKLFDIT